MNFAKGKITWLSALLIAGGCLSAPAAGFAQGRGHGSASIQAAPNRTQPNMGRPGGQRNNFGRWNNGRQWNNGWDRGRGWGGGRFGYSFGAPAYPYYYGYYGTPYYGYGDYGYGAPFGYDAYGVPYDFYYRSYSNSNAYNMGYSDGVNAGRYDRLHGNLYNPRQYERSGDGIYFSGFVAGYEDGYRY